jgi:hypothetical protein
LKRRSSEEKKLGIQPKTIETTRPGLASPDYLDGKSRSPKVMSTQKLGDLQEH